MRFLHVQTRQQTLNKDLQLIEDSGFPGVVESNNDDLVLCETSKHSRNRCDTVRQLAGLKRQNLDSPLTPILQNILM